MIDQRGDLSCESVDEVAPAYALGAVAMPEEQAISEHLASCARPHAEARSLIDAAALVPASLEPVTPSAGLRRRLMTTIANTPQEHVAAQAGSRRAAEPPRRWWQMGALPTAVAAAGLAAAVGLGAWGISLNETLAERDAALRTVAAADAIYAASGPAGTGWIIESGDSAVFMAEDLAGLPADRLYELWLISPDGVPTAVGTLADAEGLVMVRLDRALGDAVTFAVTIEAERVDEPTSDPVLAADLDA